MYSEITFPSVRRENLLERERKKERGGGWGEGEKKSASLDSQPSPAGNVGIGIRRRGKQYLLSLLPIRVGATRLATYAYLTSVDSLNTTSFLHRLADTGHSFAVSWTRPCQLIELQHRRAKSSCSLSFFFFKRATRTYPHARVPLSTRFLSFSSLSFLNAILSARKTRGERI